ncbi:MAG: hypothetical protein RBT55_11680 [Rhodocyclaceae bacterium]|jgi:hypothetical protein|nr:hypothetical protein [Rhodocyclaceae bacterium]
MALHTTHKLMASGILSGILLGSGQVAAGLLAACLSTLIVFALRDERRVHRSGLRL